MGLPHARLRPVVVGAHNAAAGILALLHQPFASATRSTERPERPSEDLVLWVVCLFALVIEIKVLW